MTRSEYIEALGKALEGADASIRDDIIKEMESHIDELSERKPELAEEDLVESLSPPAALAAGLLDELGLSVAAKEASGKAKDSGGGGDREEARSRQGRRPVQEEEAWQERKGGSGFGDSPRPEADEGFGFGGGKHRFRIELDSDEWSESLKEGLRGLEGLGETIREAVRNAVRGFGGGTDRASRDWSGKLDVDGVEELRLNFGQADIQLRPDSGTKLILEMEIEGEPEAMAAYMPDTSREGSALRLRDLPGTRARRLDIRYPASILRLSADTSSGDIDCAAGGRDCHFSTRSGDIELRDGGHTELSSTSGDLKVKRCSALVVLTTSGDLEAEGVEGMVRAESSSGELSMEDVEGPVEVKSLSGDIELEIETGPIRAMTASGQVVLRASKAFLGGEIGSKSGDIEVDLDRANLDIYAESVSGEVSLGGEEAEDRVPHRLKATAGRGGERFLIKSVSGSIDVDWA